MYVHSRNRRPPAASAALHQYTAAMATGKGTPDAAHRGSSPRSWWGQRETETNVPSRTQRSSEPPPPGLQSRGALPDRGRAQAASAQPSAPCWLHADLLRLSHNGAAPAITCTPLPPLPPRPWLRPRPPPEGPPTDRLPLPHTDDEIAALLPAAAEDLIDSGLF